MNDLCVPIGDLVVHFDVLALEEDVPLRLEIIPDLGDLYAVRGERANLTGLVLSCIEAKFCKCIGLSNH